MIMAHDYDTRGFSRINASSDFLAGFRYPPIAQASVLANKLHRISIVFSPVKGRISHVSIGLAVRFTSRCNLTYHGPLWWASQVADRALRPRREPTPTGSVADFVLATVMVPPAVNEEN